MEIGKTPLMWSEKRDNHLYVFRNGILIFKRWLNKAGKKTQSSLLFNKNWPNEWVD